MFSIPVKIPACWENAPMLLFIGDQVYFCLVLLTSLKKLIPQVCIFFFGNRKAA